MKIKKCLAGFMILVITVLLAMPVSAAETSDKPFSINIQQTTHSVASSTNPVRIKTDSSSSYVDYRSGSGPQKFIAQIYGCSNADGSGESDCTSYAMIRDPYTGGWHEVRRPDAVVTRGTRGFIRQDVYERNFPYARLKGKYHTGFGTATGLWSPDSVYEPIGDYNN